MGGHHLAKPVIGMASTPDGGGYWLVASDGGVFAFGDAQYYGSTGGIAPGQARGGHGGHAPGGRLHWLVASDGGVFTFGNAQFFGSTGSVRLTKPIVAIVPGPGSGGYRLVASDGGVFTFGDAAFSGSMGGTPLAAPVVGGSST